jgi:hypothetical protein
MQHVSWFSLWQNAEGDATSFTGLRETKGDAVSELWGAAPHAAEVKSVLGYHHPPLTYAK